MSMHTVINAYMLGAASVPQFGALVSKTGNQTAASVALAWGSEVYDTTDWHDNSTNNSRFTIPADVTLVKATANVVSSTSSAFIYHQLDGASFYGMAYCEMSAAVNNRVNISSAILAVTPNQYLETFGNGTMLADAKTWAAIEVIDPATKYALVYKNGTTSLSASVTTTLAWDTEIADTDAWHDNATNNSRLTVPSGVSRVRVSANIRPSSGVSGQFVLSFLKGGASVRGLPARDCDVTTLEALNAVSAVLPVSAGDYFEAQAFSTNAATIPLSVQVWFSIEEIPWDACTVYKSGTQVIANNTDTPVEFGAELYDDNGFHDNATNNSRLTVPSGYTRARLSFGLKGPSASGPLTGAVRKNGSETLGLPAVRTDTAGTDNVCGIGAWVDVTPGDYFELYALQSSGGNMTLGTDNETWFCMECQ